MRREDFPILNEKVHGRALVYLDNAATTQKPQVVIDAIAEAYGKWNANVHRGVHHLSQVATKNHEEARKKVAELLHAHSEEEIIFTKGTTDSINMLARSFGDAVVKAYGMKLPLTRFAGALPKGEPLAACDLRGINREPTIGNAPRWTSCRPALRSHTPKSPRHSPSGGRSDIWWR